MLTSYRKELKDLSFSQNVELTAVVLAHFLLDWAHPTRSLAYNKDCEELIFDLLQKTMGIKVLNYKAFRRDDLAYGRFMFLGKCLNEASLDNSVKKEIESELADNLESLVLNDKEKVAHAEKRLLYFQAFLAAASKEVVEEKILPQIQFIMNRSKNFVGVSAGVIQFIKTYSIENIESLKKWTTELLNDDLLMSLQEKD